MANAHDWIIPKIKQLLDDEGRGPVERWTELCNLARPFLTPDREHLRFWRGSGSEPFNAAFPLREPDAMWLRAIVDTSEEIIRMHPPAAPLKPWLRLLRAAETQSHAALGDVLEQAVQFVDGLGPDEGASSKLDAGAAPGPTRIAWGHAIEVGAPDYGLPRTPKSTLDRWVKVVANQQLLGLDPALTRQRRWSKQTLLVAGLLELHGREKRNQPLPERAANGRRMPPPRKR